MGECARTRPPSVMLAQRLSRFLHGRIAARLLPGAHRAWCRRPPDRLRTSWSRQFGVPSLRPVITATRSTKARGHNFCTQCTQGFVLCQAEKCWPLASGSSNYYNLGIPIRFRQIRNPERPPGRFFGKFVSCWRHSVGRDHCACRVGPCAKPLGEPNWDNGRALLMASE